MRCRDCRNITGGGLHLCPVTGCSRRYITCHQFQIHLECHESRGQFYPAETLVFRYRLNDYRTDIIQPALTHRRYTNYQASATAAANQWREFMFRRARERHSRTNNEVEFDTMVAEQAIIQGGSLMSFNVGDQVRFKPDMTEARLRDYGINTDALFRAGFLYRVHQITHVISDNRVNVAIDGDASHCIFYGEWFELASSNSDIQFYNVDSDRARNLIRSRLTSSEVWKRPIHVINRNGASTSLEEPRERGVYIFLYTRPAEVDKKSVRAKTFGALFNTSMPGDSGLGFCADPSTIMNSRLMANDSRGNIFASGYFRGESPIVLVYFNCLDEAFVDDRENVFSAVMSRVAELVTYLIEDNRPLKEQFAEYKRLGNDRELKEVTKLLSSVNNNIKNQEKALTDNYLQQKSLMNRLAALELKTSNGEDFEKEMKRILRKPKVAGLRFEQDTLVVRTKEIESPRLSDGSIRLFGEYDLRFRKYYPPEVVNLTRSVMNKPHPHAHQDGRMCWGNVAAGITQLTADNDLLPLIDLILAFLSSVDEKETYGKYVFRWPCKTGDMGQAYKGCEHPRHEKYTRTPRAESPRALNCDFNSCEYCCGGDHNGVGFCLSAEEIAARKTPVAVSTTAVLTIPF